MSAFERVQLQLQIHHCYGMKVVCVCVFGRKGWSNVVSSDPESPVIASNECVTKLTQSRSRLQRKLNFAKLSSCTCGAYVVHRLIWKNRLVEF